MKMKHSPEPCQYDRETLSNETLLYSPPNKYTHIPIYVSQRLALD